MERGNIEHKLWSPSPRSPPHTFSLGLLQKREVDVGMRGNGIERLSEGQSWGQMLALSIVNEVRCSSPLLPLLPCAFASRFHSNLNK